jgi:hypothetical protein
MGAD